MENREKLIFGLIATLFIALSFVLVFLNKITYQEALEGAPVWGSVMFGIFQWRYRSIEKREAEFNLKAMQNRIDRLTTTNHSLEQGNLKLMEHIDAIKGRIPHTTRPKTEGD